MFQLLLQCRNINFQIFLGLHLKCLFQTHGSDKFLQNSYILNGHFLQPPHVQCANQQVQHCEMTLSAPSKSQLSLYYLGSHCRIWQLCLLGLSQTKNSLTCLCMSLTTQCHWCARLSTLCFVLFSLASCDCFCQLPDSALPSRSTSKAYFLLTCGHCKGQN